MQEYSEKLQKKENQIEDLRRAGAVWLFSLYRKYLEKYTQSGKLYENTTYFSTIIEKIHRNFFMECTTFTDIDRAYLKYRWCVGKAIEIVENKIQNGEKGFIQYPDTYFDTINNSNTGVFQNLFQKYNEAQKRKANRINFKNQPKKATNQQKYIQILRKYQDRQADLRTTHTYIKQNIPDFEDEFLTTVVNMALVPRNKCVVFEN